MEIEHGGSRLSNVLRAKEDMLKSPEQLENEKREILAKRIVKIAFDGKERDVLIDLIHKFHETLINLNGSIYDLTEKHDRQKYDMMELAERARQIEKGKAKTRKSNIVHTGLGGSVFGKLSDNFPQAPGKISLFSRYERVTDRRTLKERRDVFAQAKEEKDFVPFKPKAKLKELDTPVKKGRNINQNSRLKRILDPAQQNPKKTQELQREPQREQPQELHEHQNYNQHHKNEEEEEEKERKTREEEHEVTRVHQKEEERHEEEREEERSEQEEHTHYEQDRYQDFEHEEEDEREQEQKEYEQEEEEEQKEHEYDHDHNHDHEEIHDEDRNYRSNYNYQRYNPYEEEQNYDE